MRLPQKIFDKNRGYIKKRFLTVILFCFQNLA
jgi:hypothetical protein